jgi:hypothetical protein
MFAEAEFTQTILALEAKIPWWRPGATILSHFFYLLGQKRPPFHQEFPKNPQPFAP